MESPLLQPVPTPKRRVVKGVHVTRGSRVSLRVTRVADDYVEVFFGHGAAPDRQALEVVDLRELSTLFAELADALESK